MADIKKIVRIKKQSYRFELKRKYSNRKKFKVNKKQPMEVLREGLLKALLPKGTTAADLKRKFVVPVALLLAVLAAMFLIFQAPAEQPPAQVSNFTGAPPSLQLSINGSGVASLGSYVGNLRAAYYKLNYRVGNASNFSVTAFTYPSRIPNQVFILETKNYEAQMYPEFKDALKKRLDSAGLPLNEISLGQVETLPAGALLIVPTGLIPERMVQPGGANVVDLMARGVTILYIGQRFDSQGQSISETGAQRRIPAEMLSKMPFAFQYASLKSNGTLGLASTLYKVEGAGYGSSTQLLYGVVGAIKAKGGVMLFVPQTLDSGWGKSHAKAADDVARIVSDLAWLVPEAQSTVYPGFEENRSFYSFFTSPQFKEREKSVLIRAKASNPSSSAQKMAVILARADTNGDLFYNNPELDAATKVVSGKITEEDTKFIVELRETANGTRKLMISISDVYGAPAQAPHSIVSGSSGQVDLQSSPQFSERLNLDGGTYMASILDDSGNAYARAILQVTGVQFSASKQDFVNSAFAFGATADGVPAKIKRLKISVDGKYNFTFAGQSEYEINLQNSLRGLTLEPGNHTFLFEYTGGTQTLTLTRVQRKEFWDNPIIWFLGLLAILIFGGTAIIAPMLSKVEYSLDIPDFPPLASIKIPMKKEAVLGVLEKINEDYRWKDTPLRLEEIKKGFRKIIYQSRPVFISDYNLEYILEKLEGKGDVKSSLEYYGLAKWEQDTGRSIKSLAIQRKIRDICINEAIPFSKFGESPDYDMALKVLGQDVFVYIIDSPSVREQKLSLALRMMQKGLAVLLFANAEEKKDFEDTMNSASVGGGVVKLEMMAGSVVPLGIKEFERMLKEMKSI